MKNHADNSALRILHVLPFSGMGGGAPRAMLTLAAEQQRRRPTWVLSLADNDFAAEARKTGATVMCVYPTAEWPASRLGRWLRSVRAIRQAVRAHRIELIHCHSAPGNRYCYPASRLTGVPLVSHQRDNYQADHFHAWLHRTDHIIAVSEWVRSQLPAALQEKATMVHDAVAIPPESAIVWPKETGPIVVGMAGRCIPEKGQDVFVEAMLELVGTLDIEVELWGFQETLPEVEFARQLQAKITASGKRERFHLSGYRMDMDNFYRCVDVVVVPSRYAEPLGLVAMEAMAWGKATVVSAHGGLIESVKPEATGLAFTPGDAKNLAAQMQRLCADRPLMQRLARAGRQAAAAQFTAAAHADHIDAVYRRILNR